MINKATVWGTLLPVGLLSFSAFAGPVGNTSQKGSLLIFPKIDVSDAHETIVRLTNDGKGNVRVKCYYLTELFSTPGGLKKDVVDFEVTLTKNHPI